MVFTFRYIITKDRYDNEPTTPGTSLTFNGCSHCFIQQATIDTDNINLALCDAYRETMSNGLYPGAEVFLVDTNGAWHPLVQKIAPFIGRYITTK